MSDLNKLADWLAHMQRINTLPLTDPICAEHMANLKAWESDVRYIVKLRALASEFNSDLPSGQQN